MLQRLQQPQRVGCVGLECIQRPMEHFFNAPETNWDRVDWLSKESKPILFVFGLVCFWYDSGWYGIQMHSVEVPLGPTNRKKLERTLQDGSFGVCLGDVWNIVTVTDFIVLARNTSTLYKAQQDSTFFLLYPCRKWRRDSLWAWFLAWVFQGEGLEWTNQATLVDPSLF